MAVKKVKIPNRRAAIGMVASSLVGHLESTDFDELLGCTPVDINRLTDAEMQRLTEAIEIVGLRLSRMYGG